MFRLKSEQIAEAQRYQDLMHSPVTEKVGPINAKRMFQDALADPVKMATLINASGGGPDMARRLVKEVFEQAQPFKNGQYDPDGIIRMLHAGEAPTADSKPSMALLFEKAYGAKEGQQHWEVLNAIANFMKRDAMTAPEYLRPNPVLGGSPVKEATGQGMASWIAAGRAQMAGQVGSTYFAALGLSRFINAKVQAKIAAAERKALYDPETARAVLEMASTNATEPLALTTFQKIFGNLRLEGGKKLVDSLVDRGYVRQFAARGAVFGAEKSQQDTTDPNDRNTARRLRAQQQPVQ